MTYNFKKAADSICSLELRLWKEKLAISLASAEAHKNSVSILFLPTLAENALRSAGIDDLKKLIHCSRVDLAVIPNLGRKSIEQISTTMKERNMYLSGR